MPSLLSEAYRNDTLPPPSNVSNVRTKRKNYTMIEGFDMSDQYVDIDKIGVTTPSKTVGTNSYNSDDIVAPTKSRIRSSPPSNYMKTNNLSNFPPQFIDQYNNEQMRTESFKDRVTELSENFYPVSVDQSGGSPYPPAQVPYLKSAIGMNDKNSVMTGNRQHIREGYNHNVYGYGSRYGYPQHYGMNCMDTVSHVMNCPMCSRYFRCDTRIYNIIIFMLIVVFTVILYFLYKEEKR